MGTTERQVGKVGGVDVLQRGNEEMRAKRGINWGKLWKEFNAWSENPNTRCESCGKTTKYFPSWEMQRTWIQGKAEEMLIQSAVMTKERK